MLCRQYRLLFNKFKCTVAVKCSSVSAAVLDFQEMPSPKGLPIVGTTLSLLAAGSAPKLHRYVDKRHRELGPIYKEKIGPVSAVFLSDPTEMRAVFAQEGKYPIHILPEAWMVYNEIYGCSRGLFFMDGEEWLHFRRIMNKLLLKGNLNWIESCCLEASKTMLNRIRLHENKEFPNLEFELYKWSIDVLISILLGPDVYKSSYKNLECHINHLASTVHLIFQTTAKLSLISAKFASKYKIPRWKRFVNSVDSALAVANDLVFNLLENYPNGDGLLHKMQHEQIPVKEIVRIVIDLVLAAGDTTAYSMEWMLYLISKNSDIQQQLRKEHISNPQLIRNILRETLRLYPVAPFLTRILPETSQICRYQIPAGSLIVMSIFSTGRDSKYYENPERFYPDRWIRTDNSTTAAGLQQHASLPFAIGARSCIGRRIAEVQLQLTLGVIVKNYDVELCNKNDVDVILKMVAVPSERIRLKFKAI